MNKALIVIYTILITALCVIGAHRALGDEAFILRGGTSVDEGKLSGASKVFGLRYETHVFRGIYSAYELGGYVDNNGNGRKGAALAKFAIGITPGRSSGIFGKAFTGPCFITTTDRLLGSNYQFCTDFGVGLRDQETLLGITYSHISNAGLKSPNRGRDFIVMEAGVRW